MSISKATEHLATSLLSHYQASDPAACLLRRIAQISSYVGNGNLAEWETDVLASVEDLDAIEQRHDFPLIESVWEVGRFNLFGAIQASQTKELYLQASKLLNEAHAIQVRNVSEFDFSKW